MLLSSYNETKNLMDDSYYILSNMLIILSNFSVVNAMVCQSSCVLIYEKGPPRTSNIMETLL